MKYTIENLLKYRPFEIKKENKRIFFKKYFQKLNIHHYNSCKEYKLILDNLKFKVNNNNQLDQFPILPVNIFKDYDLVSTKKENIIKKILSSGTTGKNLSKINLDKENASRQMKVLSKILENIIGSERLPMMIIDNDPLKNRGKGFNARMAAILGFSLLGKNYCYALDENENLNFEKIESFMKNFGNKKFLIFGFTSLIFEKLVSQNLFDKKKLNFRNGILIHGGGWKKLEKKKVDNKQFKQKLKNKINLRQIYNYYGLVEQTGSIFIEGSNCEYLHSSIFSDILIRDKNFKILKNGKRGLIQLLSLLPTSYPGHNILTEDLGEIVGEDDCKCGLKGKYFKIYGRIKEAELRGCSDVQ